MAMPMGAGGGPGPAGPAAAAAGPQMTQLTGIQVTDPANAAAPPLASNQGVRLVYPNGVITIVVQAAAGLVVGTQYNITTTQGVFGPLALQSSNHATGGNQYRF